MSDTITEDGERLEIVHLESRGIMQYQGNENKGLFSSVVITQLICPLVFAYMQKSCVCFS